MTRALAIIDAEGLVELSTRRLARDLQVSAPSLYNDFATKEEILDAVADTIVARPAPRGGRVRRSGRRGLAAARRDK